MLRIGLVDLDTSHPKAFTTILNQMDGVKVTALWDGHDVYPEGYDRQFAKDVGVEYVCSSLSDLVPMVDAAMIHGVDWDKHIDKALPFLQAGKLVLIDKPIVGCVKDIDRLLELRAKYGTPIYGGSSLRFADEVQDLNRMKKDFGKIHVAHASGPGDIFAYGIHTTEMAQGVLGTGVESVEFLGEHGTALYKVNYRSGLILILHLHTPYHEWSLALHTDTGLHTMKIDPTKVYSPFLSNFVRMLRGEKVEFSLSDTLESVKIHIAAEKSRKSGTAVVLDELLSEDGFDGASHAVEYAASKKL